MGYSEEIQESPLNRPKEQIYHLRLSQTGREGGKAGGPDHRDPGPPLGWRRGSSGLLEAFTNNTKC